MEEALADQDEQLKVERAKEDEETEKKPKTTRKRKAKDNTGKGKRAKKKAAPDQESSEERSPEEQKKPEEKPDKRPREAHPIVMVKSSGGDIDGTCEIDRKVTWKMIAFSCTVVNPLTNLKMTEISGNI